MDSLSFTPYEMMIVAAARRFRNDATAFVGVGLPSVAACVARSLQAAGVVLVYESGTIGAKPTVAPLSIADLELAETADVLVSLPEIFSYWVQAGRIDMAFLGAAQIDRFGNVNTTVIGDYGRPKVRMPGAGGAPEIALGAREIVLVAKHNVRAFVAEVDFVTTRLHGKQHVSIITDLGVLQADAASGELCLVSCHSGVTVADVRAATGWPLKIAPSVRETEFPTEGELQAVRDVEQRTHAAHHE